MKEFFKTGDLKHVRGQEGVIHDIEKAREMAESENTDRSLFVVQEYKDYLANPSTDNPLAERFGYFQEYGVTPEYLETLADVRAERVGANYDAELLAPTKSTLRLHWERLLADISLALNHGGLEPTQGVPPATLRVNDETVMRVAWANKSAANAELQKRYREYRKLRSAQD